MICKKCGKEFDGLFCPDCGTQAVEEVTRCPKCGQERMGNSKFCASCGFNFENQIQLENVENRNPSGGNTNSNKFLSIFAKIYRWLIAGGMIFVGIVSLLCLSAPVITEELFGITEALCSGFEAISGKDASMPSGIRGASVMLLVMSLLCMAYGGFQLYLAFKKPYITAKKYYLWAIDGVISLILIILGGVMAGEANSDQLINGKLGSGFVMCIVMGVFGLVFLGLRIFYELKVFKWEDIGQETYDKIVRAEKQRKPIDKEKAKKIAIKVGIPVIIVAVLLAIIVPTVIWSQNIFRVGKVDKINIGDSKEDVIKVLGEPYEKSDYRFEYYSDDYIKLVEKIKEELGLDSLTTNMDKDLDDELGDLLEGLDKITKLEEQLNNLVYKYIRVDFNSGNKVTEVFFDAEKCESKEYKKVAKNFEVTNDKTVGSNSWLFGFIPIPFTKETTYRDIYVFEDTDFYCKVKYSDNSLYKGIEKYTFVSTDSQKFEWQDKYGNKLSKIYDVLPISYLGKEAVDIICNGNRTQLTEYVLPDFITSIGDYAFSDCSNLTSIEIPSSVTYIGDSAFSGCSSLQYNEYENGLYLGNKENPYMVLIEAKDANITRCEINANSKIICSYAFYGCSSLTSIEISSSVMSIGVNAFAECNNITRATIPTIAIEYIPKEKLQTVIINGGESIGSWAFSDCGSLTSIEISSSVTSVGDYAFYGCSNLTIYCEAESEPSGWDRYWNNSNRPVVWGYKK